MAKRRVISLKNLIVRYLLISILAAVLLVGGFLWSISAGFWGELPDKKMLLAIDNPQASEIVDGSGANLGYLYRYYRSDVTFDELPQHLIDALVATEDARFYEHNGIDYRSLARVLVKTVLLQDRSGGGGSTISQQLVKNLYPREYNNKFQLLVIKIKEVLIARKLEQLFTKDEILTLYLNTVSFPDNTFGIKAATATFFNKPVQKLTLNEAAVLIGSLKANHNYNPRIFPEASRNRRNVVLAQMNKYGQISDEIHHANRELPIQLDYKPIKPNTGVAAYFREQVRLELSKWAAEYNSVNPDAIDIYSDGLIIHTTLDKKMQLMAEESMKEHMAVLQKAFENNWGGSGPWNNQGVIQPVLERSALVNQLKAQGKNQSEIKQLISQKNQRDVFSWESNSDKQFSFLDSLQHSLKMLQVGFVALNPQDGAVKAWIGGIDFEYYKYDHVNQSKRQVGSTFKPFVYAAALENGVRPCDYFSAADVTYSNLDGWTPTNSDNEDYTNINVTMQEAMRKSMNTVSVRLMEQSGIAEVVKLAQAAGISSELPYVPSLALGTAELTLLELATAYSTFLNDGRPVKPFIITKITNANGEVLAEFKPEINDEPAFSEQTRQIVLEMMQTVVENGTASRLGGKYKLSQDIAGKTGTTQNNRDGWFVGLLPNLVAVSWVGADNGAIGFKSTSVGQGANSALPVFGLLMQKINSDAELRKKYHQNFPAPDRRVARLMDCPPTKEDGFLKKLFTNEEKQKTKDFDEEGKQNKGLLNKFKSLFKKN